MDFRSIFYPLPSFSGRSAIDPILPLAGQPALAVRDQNGHSSTGAAPRALARQALES